MSNRSKRFKKMLKRRGPSIEPCGTPVIVDINELKTESSFGVDLKDNFLSVLHYHDLHQRRAV